MHFLFQVSNVTFVKEDCNENVVVVSIPNPGKDISIIKECGGLFNEKEIKLKAGDLKLGVIRVHVKLRRLDRGSFNINWDY